MCTTIFLSLFTSLDAVKKQLDALDTYLSAQIWIINPSGRMILDSSQSISIDAEIMVENFDPTITVGSFYTVGHFFDYFEEEMLSVFAPISTDYEVKGYVVIHSSMQELEQSKENLLKISYITLLLLFLLSGIILMFFTEFVYKPLRKITTATEQYASGNMHYELQVESNDEMGYLAAILSYMAGEIAKSEDNQKKLVANVSHDFRSPLTSIKGFLEAMKDGTIPPELYPKYIGIVLNETERLIKLTNSLLTLNNLNTKNKYEISEEKWRESENEYDSKTTDLINFFEGRERIIGVKDQDQKIEISKSSSIIFWFLLIVFMLCMILSIYLAIIKEFLFVGFIGLFDIILLGVVIAEWKSLAMRISFPNEGKIKIDGKVFDYKNSDVSIFIDRYINNSGLTKYDNELVIASRDKIYTVNVELLDEKQLNQFISNLVFQNR